MSAKAKDKVKKRPPKWKYNKGKFDVVKFYEADRTKLFDSIPDLWFVNDEKTFCFWPPPTSKKSTTLRAMNQEIPGEDWDVIECEVVSEGHATYSIACNIVREKLAQNYNTSSADEHIQAARFRREHPGLIHNGQKCFEDVFAATKVSQMNEKNRSMGSQQKTSDDTSSQNKASDENLQPPPVCSESYNIDLEIFSELPKSSSGSRVIRSEQRESRCQSRSNDTSNHNNEVRDGSNQSTLVHSESRNNRLESDSESGKRCSGSQADRGESYRNHSERKIQNYLARSNRSQSRESRSRSYSNGTSNKNNRSRNGNQQSPLVHIDSRNGSRSLSQRSRSRSQRSRSRSQRSRSRSRRVRSSLQRSGSHDQLRDVRSQRSSDHSQPRSNRSNSDWHNSQHDNRSRSGSNDLESPSTRRKRSRGFDLRSREKRFESSGYSQKHSNRLLVHNIHSQPSSYRSQSESDDNDRRTRYSTDRKTYPDKSARNHRSNRSSFCDLSGRNHFNGTNTQRSDLDQHRKIHSNAEKSKPQKDNSPVSRQDSNRLRVEEMYRLHQLHRTANLSTAPSNSQTVSLRNTQVHRVDRQHHREIDSPELVNKNSDHESGILQTLLKKVSDIERTVTKNDRRLVEYDRRLNRMEVTVNKTFIVLGDVQNAINIRAVMGSTRPIVDKPPKGFRTPKMPIYRLRDLVSVNEHLLNKDFFSYLVNCEKEFCCASSSTDTATMTAYLRRFIDVDLRAKFVLKDLKGQEGMTLYHDFYQVYLFLIETMKAGYLIKHKILTNKDVHVVLRTVWGRSKQTADECHKTR